MTAKEFSRAVLSELRKAGWSGRGKTVWARCGDGDVCVDLQKSNYDETVFVNVGVTLHALGNAKRVQVHGLSSSIPRRTPPGWLSWLNDGRFLRNPDSGQEQRTRASGSWGTRGIAKESRRWRSRGRACVQGSQRNVGHERIELMFVRLDQYLRRR